MPSHCFSSACACNCTEYKIRDVMVDDGTYAKIKRVLGEIDQEKLRKAEDGRRSRKNAIVREIDRLRAEYEEL